MEGGSKQVLTGGGLRPILEPLQKACDQVREVHGPAMDEGLSKGLAWQVTLDGLQKAAVHLLFQIGMHCTGSVVLSPVIAEVQQRGQGLGRREARLQLQGPNSGRPPKGQSGVRGTKIQSTGAHGPCLMCCGRPAHGDIDRWGDPLTSQEANR